MLAYCRMTDVSPMLKMSGRHTVCMNECSALYETGTPFGLPVVPEV